MTGFAGVEITVEQETNGPPVGKAVNIEIRGDNFNSLVNTSQKLKRYLDDKNIPGVDEFREEFLARCQRLGFSHYTMFYSCGTQMTVNVWKN